MARRKSRLDPDRPLSFVGASQGARKRAARRWVFAKEDPIAEGWWTDEARARYRIGERLRPCPGCFDCQGALRFELLLALRQKWINREAASGFPMFKGRPDRWYERPTWMCQHWHVTHTILKTDKGDRCLACYTAAIMVPPWVREVDCDGSGVLPARRVVPQGKS